MENRCCGKQRLCNRCIRFTPKGLHRIQNLCGNIIFINFKYRRGRHHEQNLQSDLEQNEKLLRGGE